MPASKFTEMERPSDMVLAYIAGFVDGEGTINICGTNPAVNLSITNTNREILEYIQTQIGGTIHTRTRKSDKWKTAYDLALSTKTAIRAILWLIPFLRIKKERAIAAIQFDSERPGRGFSWDPVIKTQWQQRFHDFNRRGPPKEGAI